MATSGTIAGQLEPRAERRDSGVASSVQKLRAKAALPLAGARLELVITMLRTAHAGATCESAARTTVIDIMEPRCVRKSERSPSFSSILARRVLSAEFVTHQP
jgi:hypothetical protein